MACVIAVALAACGSSNSTQQANTLLRQTFSGTHPVNSGNLSFSLTVDPTGSSTLRTPISINFGGPFQSQGTGKLPQSNFNVGVSADGKTSSVGILSTGHNGYVTLQGVSYQLPASTFQKLESSFAGLTASPSGGSGTGVLGKLGIQPLHWLNHATVVGTETVGGATTTHIRATINVAGLLGDLNTFLQKASSVGVSGASKIPSSISAATRQQIASEVQSPTFDVWTGNSDKTVRQLMLRLTLPVTGQVSTLLGGLSSAAISLTMRYADLNQPQTIGTPTNVQPFSEFQSKLRTFLGSIESTLGTSGTSTTSGTASLGTSTTSSTSGASSGSSSGTSGSTTALQNYSQCITNAHNDVTKMQQCASLINGQ